MLLAFANTFESTVPSNTTSPPTWRTDREGISAIKVLTRLVKPDVSKELTATSNLILLLLRSQICNCVSPGPSAINRTLSLSITLALTIPCWATAILVTLSIGNKSRVPTFILIFVDISAKT
ncbi:hypothetical protein PPAR_a2171 [Pseudoalteromonas paragorgicola KMM 3548]|nr:hypothetical protein [Pseudoalteromonas distincta KMM 3548]